jgi:ABC-type phosphate transport system substrate-binding protein
LSPEIGKGYETALSGSVRGIKVAFSDFENADLIEKTPGSFGFCTLTQLIMEGHDIKAVKFNNALPTVNGQINKDYPLMKPLFYITGEKYSNRVRRFIDFLRSVEAKKIIENSGNIAIAENAGGGR